MNAHIELLRQLIAELRAQRDEALRDAFGSAHTIRALNVENQQLREMLARAVHSNKQAA